MYALLLANCIACSRPFSCNPDLVPTVRVRRRRPDDPPGPSLIGDPAAPREPLCRDCAEAVNRAREAQGFDGWEIHDGAYEPQSEP